MQIDALSSLPFQIHPLWYLLWLILDQIYILVEWDAKNILQVAKNKFGTN